MRREATLQRLEKRVDKLCGSIDYYLDSFEKSKPFTGPSVYFHDKTLEMRRSHKSPSSLLADDRFFDYLYATLAAWGMHRMGPKGAKLLPLPEIVASFAEGRQLLNDFWNTHLASVLDGQVGEVGATVLELLSSLKVSATKAKLVASSKALHHLLPDLVPPIDREYTLRFFFNNKIVAGDGAQQFLDVFRGYHQIAKRAQDALAASLDKDGFSGSVPKVIDNAIVGYVIEELRAPAVP